MTIMGVSLANIFTLLVIVTTGVHSLHFRGGTFNWRPTGNGNEVEITYRMSFNGFRDGSEEITPGHQVCNETSKDEQIHLKTPGYMHCKGNCYGWKNPKMDWICTDFSREGGWDNGGKTFTWTLLSAQRTALILHNECCWVDGLQNVDPHDKQGWRMMTEIDLRPRDNGVINSSPITSPRNVQLFHKNCNYHLEIPVTDPDNDRYRCRYTNPSYDECYIKPSRIWSPAYGDVCGELSHVTVYDNCTLEFDTSGPAGWYAVRVMIEDLDQYGNPKSKISLSFLLNVSSDATTCKSPKIISPESGCKTIPVNEPYQTTIVAEAATEELPITRIETSKPPGMNELDLQDVPGHPLRKIETLKWTPTSDQIGRHNLGFDAFDKDGFSSGLSAVYLNVVKGERLLPLREQSMPFEGHEISSTKSWMIKFNRPIRRPSQSAYITLMDEMGNEASQPIDASDEQQVEFKNKKVIFHISLTGNGFSESQTFYLRVDEGVAIDEEYDDCYLFSSPAVWKVIVKATQNQLTNPTRPTVYKPPCTTGEMDIRRTPYTKGSEECFVHFHESTLTVRKNRLNMPYTICCSSDIDTKQSTTTRGSPATRGPPAPPGKWL